MRICDGEPAFFITSQLESADSDLGQPLPLAANLQQAFRGSTVLGMGFILTSDEAMDLIDHNPKNRQVLFPYLGGEDLNTRPDCSAGRWVIDFRDRPESAARQYPEAWKCVEERVRPERMMKDAVKYPRMVQFWWQHWNMRPELYRTIGSLERVIAIARVSATVAPIMVRTGAVFTDQLIVFAYEKPTELAILSSGFHYCWAITYGSTMRTDLRYTPTDIFETFPRPNGNARMDTAGEILEVHRRPLMLRRRLGLTALYKLVNDPDTSDPEVTRLREIHVEIDQAVAEAYGWSDIRLVHGFHDTPQGVRFTIADETRRQTLKRLLQLNHQRHAEELARGVAPQRGRRQSGQMSLVEA